MTRVKDSPYDNDFVDDLAKEAMKAILQGLYSHPNMLGMMADIAAENKKSVNQEVAERSYLMAIAMVKRKHEVLKKEQE